jgi:hypothetical protein
MALTLLKKSDIDRLKATERSQTIAEGKKLAERVDRLRQLQAEEEHKLHLFRQEALTHIHEEITTETDTLNALKKEVTDLKKEREELQKPLDEAWEDVARERNHLHALRLEVETEKLTQERDRADLDNERRDAERAALKLSNLLREAEDNARDTATAKNEAAETLALAHRSLQEATNRKLVVDEHERRTIERLALREKNITLKAAKLQRSEAALKKQWALLRDRQAMLKRYTSPK